MPVTSAVAGRDQALDALKGLAIIGVLFAHMNFSARLSDSTLGWISVVQQIFGWCVIAFFFGAGLLTRIEGERLAGWLPFALKRARRLLLPCLAFSLTYKCSLLALKGFGAIRESAVLPPRNFFAIVEFLLAPVGPQFYFLPYLFVISAISVLAVAVAGRAVVVAWVVLAGCCAHYCLMPPPRLTYGPSAVLIPGYCFSFWLGLMARQGWCANRLWWFAVFAAVLVGSVIRASLSYAQFILPLLLYCALCQVRCGGGLTYLGKKAGAIYVWHDPLLLPACSIFAMKFVPGEVMQVILIITFGIGISILLGEAVNRFSFLSLYRF